MGNFLTEAEKKQRPVLTRALSARIAAYLLPYWKPSLLVLFLILASTSLAIYPALLSGRILDEGLIAGNRVTLIRLVLLSLGVTLLSNLLGILEGWLNSWIAQHIAFDLRNQLYRHLLSLSQRFFTETRQGDVLTRMTGDISGVENVIALTLPSLLRNGITLIAVLFAMYRMNWILASLGLILVPLFFLPARAAGRRRWKLTTQVQEKTDEVNSILTETLSVGGQLMIKLLGREEREVGQFQSAGAAMVRLKIQEGLSGRWFRAVISTVTAAGPLLIYLAGGFLLQSAGNSLSVGDITVMAALLTRMYQPVNGLLSIQVDVTRSLALFSRIFHYLDLEPEIRNAKEPIKPQNCRGALSFRDVRFQYESGRSILQNISFNLAPGKTLALVGPSGAGKSTLTSLIPRLYDVSAGEILLDGLDIRKLDLASLRGNIAMVTQDTFLFNSTIRENLLYAKPTATEEELSEACRKANILDFIHSQPLGYDTLVGNQGLKLSGGEKQRLSIARAILQDPALIILDEATSSLDSISEALIQAALEPLLKERTAIVIAHRLSTVMAADEILVLESGRLREQGRHADLLQLNGLYRQLYETQFKAALEQERKRIS